MLLLLYKNLITILYAIITWGVRCDQSESWIAVEYMTYYTVIQSETAISKRVELLTLRLQVGRPWPRVVQSPWLAECCLSLPPDRFSFSSHLEWNNYRTLECQTHPLFSPNSTQNSICLFVCLFVLIQFLVRVDLDKWVGLLPQWTIN